MFNLRRPSPALVIALFALFVALSGVGIAATGGNFILGQTNTADATSSLQGSIASGPALEAANPAAGGGIVGKSSIGRGVVGQHTGSTGKNPGVEASTASTDPAATALFANNPGGGPAAAFTVLNSSVKPFTVNSNSKVTGLNVDLVDSLDSVVEASTNGVGAVRGRLTSGRQQLSGAEAGPFTIIITSGFANVNAEKNANDDCTITFLNPQLNPSAYTFTRQVFPSGGTASFTDGTLAPGASSVAGPFATGAQVRWQAWATGNPSSTIKVVTVDAFTRASGTTCDFGATMYAGGS